MISQKRKKELRCLMDVLGLTCTNYELIDKSLTHSSYTFENKLSSLENNERLEFLGDAVLKLTVSAYLLERFPDYSEGELTKIRAIIVSDSILAKVATNINLGKFIKLGYHEDKLGGRNRPSNLACAFEALLGAIYLNNNDKELKAMLANLLDDEITIINECAAKCNYKAILQEFTQAKGYDLPDYVVVEEIGPSHNKVFVVEVLIDNKLVGRSEGKSKKEAQQKVAEIAVKKLGVIDECEDITLI